MSEGEIDKYIKLNLPLYTIGLFDNKDLPHSTPSVKFENIENFKNSGYNLSYYLYAVDETREHGTTYEITYLTDEFKVVRNFARKYNRVNKYYPYYSDWIPHNFLTTHPNEKYNMNFLTTHPNGKFNMVVLRSAESYGNIMRYILNLHQKIRNADIDNGLSQFSLKLPVIDQWGDEIDQWGARVQKRSDYIMEGEEVSNFLISTTYAIGGGYEFCSGTLYQLLSRYKPVDVLVSWGFYGPARDAMNDHYEVHKILNKLWESKTHREHGQSVKSSYFDYLFGNYAFYQIELYNLSKRYHNDVLNFPLQLTLISDENNTVFEFQLKNLLNTDEISRVKKYTISKPNRN